MAIILPAEWRTQPQVPVGVARSSLTDRLELLAPLHPGQGFVNLVSGEMLTRTGALTGVPSRLGVYPTFSSSSYVNFNAALGGIGYTDPTTIAWTQEPQATSAYSVILHWRATGSTNPFLIYCSASDANYHFVVGVGNGSYNLNRRYNSALGAVTNNRVDAFCLLLPSGASTGADSVLYRNGVEVAGATAAGSNTFSTSTATGGRIGYGLTGFDPFEGLIGNFHIWRRTLTDSEARYWTRNPFATRAPLRSRKWFGVAAAGSVPTLSFSTYKPGTLTADGWQPRVTAS